MATTKENLVSLSDFAWQRLRNRLDGLTDEEYRWEPVPDCWSVRPVGDGSYRRDGTSLPPEPAPVTTVSWRMCHLIDILQAKRTATWLGLEPSAGDGQPGVPGTATAALADLEHAYAVWRRRLTAVAEDILAEDMGELAGPYAKEDRAAFVLHILDEFIHYGAEVGVLRDLYRASQPEDPFVLACLRGERATVESMRAADPHILDRTLAEHPNLLGRAAALQRWGAVHLLADFGFGVDVAVGPSVPSPLHYAAGAGELDAVRLLVDRGADVTATDPRFHHTPLGWAQYFHRNEVIDYLTPITPA